MLKAALLPLLLANSMSAFSMLKCVVGPLCPLEPWLTAVKLSVEVGQYQESSGLAQTGIPVGVVLGKNSPLEPLSMKLPE